ncbi:MAG TPA: ornithine carbamoyltransferase [Pirellulales bacterium]|jgi:ornithine carbamoyltransferase|nr:ornithine carbamoyltransferase [Pirellulales bacterium]
MRHLITLADLKSAEIERIFAITEDLKSKYDSGLREQLLPGRVMALLFEKPSLRTRVSFEAGMAHLGGNSLFLGEEVGFGNRESIADFGRVLSEYVDVIVVRTRSHQKVIELAEFSSCSVINGLTDYDHPCQALADLYTLRELNGPLEGQTLAYIGDGNNVARSLARGCGKMGMKFRLAAPPGYHFDKPFLANLKKDVPELKMTVGDDPREIVRDVDAVYTDVWTSMGQEAEAEKRRGEFAAFQVNEELMKAAPKKAWFMHCLPAKRGEEVTDAVIDGPNSVVVQQAANRLHVQKGILAWLLGAQR